MADKDVKKTDSKDVKESNPLLVSGSIIGGKEVDKRKKKYRYRQKYTWEDAKWTPKPDNWFFHDKLVHFPDYETNSIIFFESKIKKGTKNQPAQILRDKKWWRHHFPVLSRVHEQRHGRQRDMTDVSKLVNNFQKDASNAENSFSKYILPALAVTAVVGTAVGGTALIGGGSIMAGMAAMGTSVGGLVSSGAGILTSAVPSAAATINAGVGGLVGWGMTQGSGLLKGLYDRYKGNKTSTSKKGK